MEAQLTLSDKFPFIFSRGTPQVMDGFEMLRDFRGLSDAEFAAAPHCYTIINTNSPRQIDIPMAQGLIDFAKAGQLSIVTPFCLMGAMAPVTVAGALTLSHAEALAAITLTQLARPGAPVCYGAFASNVDMKSGAPAFGTPEQVKANLGAGQLALLLGLPWRCAAGCAANINDAQAANETQISAWGAVLAGATVLIHGAGWIEGGLTVSYEKLITDLEVMQIFAELCAETPAGDDEIALDALIEVEPGGHFFDCAHTMERYATAFYEPLVADWSNFGAWTERGAKDASQRATGILQQLLETAPAFEADASRVDALNACIARRTKEGGAPDVIFVPGGDSTAEAYAHLFARLSDRFRCIAYDPCGAGDTISPPAPWRIEEMGADCAAVIKACCDGPAVVTGLSMGGLITQAAAIGFPDLVRLAIPMGTAAYFDGFTRDWMQAEIDVRRDGVVLPDYFLPVHYAAYAYAYPAKALHDADLWAQIKEAYTARFVNREPKDLINQWQACLDFDCREGLKTCPTPIHVIAFSEDVQTAPAMCKVVSDLAPNGRFHEIPKLGHVSLLRHRPDIVDHKLREIIMETLQ